MANAKLLLKKTFAAADAYGSVVWQNWQLLQFSSAKTVRYGHFGSFTGGEPKMTFANTAAANTLSAGRYTGLGPTGGCGKLRNFPFST